MSVKPEKINALLGIEVPVDVMTNILERLNFGVNAAETNLNLLCPATATIFSAIQTSPKKL